MTKRDVITNSWIWLFCLILYLVAIFILSHMQISQLPSVVFWDKGVHFLEYLPVGFFVAGWFRIVLKQRPSWQIGGIAIMVILVLGGLDELHQYFVPTREASFFDVIADTLGGIFGVGLAFVVLRKVVKPQEIIS